MVMEQVRVVRARGGWAAAQQQHPAKEAATGEISCDGSCDCSSHGVLQFLTSFSAQVPRQVHHPQAERYASRHRVRERLKLPPEGIMMFGKKSLPPCLLFHCFGMRLFSFAKALMCAAMAIMAACNVSAAPRKAKNVLFLAVDVRRSVGGRCCMRMLRFTSRLLLSPCRTFALK